MKKISVSCLLLVCSLVLNGQPLTDSLLNTFYNKTLGEYFISIDKEIMEPGEILVKTNHNPRKLNKFIGPNILKYISEEGNLNKYFLEGKSRSIYSISHKYITNDTLDLIITEQKLKIENTKKYILVSCGGTFGYVPNGRFIYNEKTNNWNFQSGNDIIEKKLYQLFEN